MFVTPGSIAPAVVAYDWRHHVRNDAGQRQQVIGIFPFDAELPPHVILVLVEAEQIAHAHRLYDRNVPG